MSGQDIRETYLEAGEFFASVVDQVDIDGWDGPALGEWVRPRLDGTHLPRLHHHPQLFGETRRQG